VGIDLKRGTVIDYFTHGARLAMVNFGRLWSGDISKAKMSAQSIRSDSTIFGSTTTDATPSSPQNHENGR
jgi:hypothetical protein